MKHKCTRCGDVLEFKDAPVRKFAIIGLIIGLVLGAIATIGFVQLEISPQWVTDQTLINQTNNALNFGRYQGQQLTLINILNATTTCRDTFEITADNQSYNIVLLECLNLNNEGGK